MGTCFNHRHPIITYNLIPMSIFLCSPTPRPLCPQIQFLDPCRCDQTAAVLHPDPYQLRADPSALQGVQEEDKAERVQLSAHPRCHGRYQREWNGHASRWQNDSCPRPDQSHEKVREGEIGATITPAQNKPPGQIPLNITIITLLV